MKNIIIPTDIILIDPESKIEHQMSFSEFMLNNVLKDKRLGVNYQTVKIAQKLTQEAKHLMAGENWSLSDEEFNILQQLISQPTQPYNMDLVFNIISFLDCFFNKKEELEK